MDKVRAALIGYGGMGKQYVQMLREGAVEGMALTGVCCRNAAGQAELKSRYPGLRIYPNADAMFADGESYDAVVIVTPHPTHVELAMRAAQLGKHILMDKPAGVSTQEVRVLLEWVRAQGVAYGMIFNMRAYPAYQKAKELLEEGRLGQVQRFLWTCNSWYRSPAYHRSSPWRSTWQGECGGLLINQCQHNFDLLQWMFGMPEHLYAGMDYGKYNEFAVDDGADIQLTYAHGLRGTFVASTGEAPGVNRLEIWGTGGRLMVEDNCKVTLCENVPDTVTFGRENTEIYAGPKSVPKEIPVSPDGSDCYQVVFTRFADHLRTGAPMLATGEDGLNALMLTNGAYLSSWLDRKVALPIDDDQYAALLQEKRERE